MSSRTLSKRRSDGSVVSGEGRVENIRASPRVQLVAKTAPAHIALNARTAAALRAPATGCRAQRPLSLGRLPQRGLRLRVRPRRVGLQTMPGHGAWRGADALAERRALCCESRSSGITCGGALLSERRVSVLHEGVSGQVPIRLDHVDVLSGWGQHCLVDAQRRPLAWSLLVEWRLLTR